MFRTKFGCDCEGKVDAPGTVIEVGMEVDAVEGQGDAKIKSEVGSAI